MTKTQILEKQNKRIREELQRAGIDWRKYTSLDAAVKALVDLKAPESKKEKPRIPERIRDIVGELENHRLEFQSGELAGHFNFLVDELKHQIEQEEPTPEERGYSLGDMENEITDGAIRKIRELGKSKGSVIYSILFRNSGVGLLWFEEKRAGPRPQHIKGIDHIYSQLIQEWAGRGLHIYKYYSSLSEALKEERKRLEEIKS